MFNEYGDKSSGFLRRQLILYVAVSELTCKKRGNSYLPICRLCGMTSLMLSILPVFFIKGGGHVTSI